jgi:amidase
MADADPVAGAPAAGIPAVTTACDDALGDHDAVSLLAAIDAGQVHRDEVLAAAMARARVADDRLNAVAAWVRSPTSGSGPFAGLPSFIKDNESVAGLPERMGSRAVPPVPSLASSEFVVQFERLGFTILGTSTMPEFGLTATTEPLLGGPTRNPWNPAHSTGGSSGGAAALVAAGVTPIAHGNDGGGSIRIPASCTGLVGLKPSRGRLMTRQGLEHLPVAISTQGVLTRSVRDTALFYAEMERVHPSLPPIGHVTHPLAGRLRIAVVTEGMGGMTVHPDVRHAVERAAHACEHLGHAVEAIPYPATEQFGRDFLRYWALLAFAIEHGGTRLCGPGFDRRRLEPLTLGLSRYARSLAPTMPATIARLRRFAQDHARLLAPYDVLLSPVLSQPAPPIGHLAPDVEFRTQLLRLLRYVPFTSLQNVAGTPAISLPLGSSRDGLPIGVQAAAGFGREALLLSLALEMEQAFPRPRVGRVGA